MARIGAVNLTITRDVANAIIKVSYTVTGSDQDVASQQPYREVCRLIGDDTPGDGVDDLIPGGLLRNVTTVFSTTATQTRNLPPITLAATALNEDVEGFAPIPDADEIRAIVTLTPVALRTSVRESEAVVLNGLPNQFEQAQP